MMNKGSDLSTLIQHCNTSKKCCAVSSLQMCVSRSLGWCHDPVDWKSWFWTMRDSKRKVTQTFKGEFQRFLMSKLVNLWKWLSPETKLVSTLTKFTEKGLFCNHGNFAIQSSFFLWAGKPKHFDKWHPNSTLVIYAYWVHAFTLHSDFAQKLAAALAHNSSSGLTTINLANNPLEDRGMIFALIYFNVLSSFLYSVPLLYLFPASQWLQHFKAKAVAQSDNIVYMLGWEIIKRKTTEDIMCENLILLKGNTE